MTFIVKENASQCIFNFPVTKRDVMRELLCYEYIIRHVNGYYFVIDPNAKNNGKEYNEIASRMMMEPVFGDILSTKIFKNLINL
jgi:hypothetical protein